MNHLIRMMWNNTSYIPRPMPFIYLPLILLVLKNLLMLRERNITFPRKEELLKLVILTGSHFIFNSQVPVDLVFLLFLLDAC